MEEIKYPPITTYFIAHYADNPIGYGENDPDQVTTSGADSLETFTDIDLYEARLLELGIEL